MTIRKPWWRAVSPICCDDAKHSSSEYSGLVFYAIDHTHPRWFIEDGHGVSAFPVTYCPWCGKKLPTRDELWEAFQK